MIRTVEQIILFGKLPFCVLLPDSLDEQGRTLPPVSPDTTEPENMLKIGLHFAGESIDAALFFRKLVNTNRLPYQKHTLAMEDLFGELAFSMFSVIVPGEHAAKLLATGPNQEDHSASVEFLIDFGTELLRKFVGIYRWETNKHWIALPTRSRMSPWKVILRDADRNSVLKPIIDYRGTGNTATNFLTQQQRDSIEKHCCSTFKYDHAYQFMETSNRLKLTGDFQGAVLYLAIYVETWLYREIRYELAKRGQTLQQVEDFFRYDDGRPKSVTRAIKDFIGGKPEFDQLELRTEYQAYREHVAELRNKIMHGTSLHISNADAEIAVQSAMGFRDYFLHTYIGPPQWTSRKTKTQ